MRVRLLVCYEPWSFIQWLCCALLARLFERAVQFTNGTGIAFNLHTLRL